MESLSERFMRYVRIYTTSEEGTGVFPSTERQKDLGRLLLRELTEMGLQNVRMDQAGNVIATFPSTPGISAPVVALMAHLDTAPDAPGEKVNPQVIRYNGGEVKLNDSVSLSEELCPGLSAFQGEDLIVTDGTTLLGADDKAGITEIMGMLEQLKEKELPHGEVRIIFSTDEEIGEGVEGLSVPELGCDYGYTVDGGALGELEYENFNAASGILTVHGIGVHPGAAKNIMRNALTVGMEFASMLPADAVPEKTEGYEGFFHLHDMEGDVNKAKLHYIIRDHDRTKFEQKKALFVSCAARINEKYGEGTAEAVVSDSYYNMKEKILPHMHLIDRASKAFETNGIKTITVPIRGGTDGARLSWDGLPCPNLSTGGYNAHSVREWIPVKSLDAMAAVLVQLICSFVNS